MLIPKFFFFFFFLFFCLDDGSDPQDDGQGGFKIRRRTRFVILPQKDYLSLKKKFFFFSLDRSAR